jgi:flavin-dependent dehydrogenase
MCVPALHELGIDLDGRAFALKKPGALFAEEHSGESLRIDFSYSLEGSFPHAYQVERAPFDHFLALRAAELGAEVRYGESVDEWSEDEGGVELGGTFGTCRARYFVDATGQQAVLGRRRRAIQPLERFGACASFTTFGGVTSEQAREAMGQGDIVIFLSDLGWNWLIPLPGDRVSVGLVERKPRAGTTAEEVLGACIEQSRFLARTFAGAGRIAPFRRITNYSYYNLSPASARTVAVGDARAFLDPIFSSGVTVAVLCARLLSGELSSALREDRALELEDYWRSCEKAYATFDRLIERFYRPDWVRNVFFAAGRDDRLVREFTAILAGDVWRTDNEIQAKLLKSRPRTGFGSEQPVA